MFSGEFWELFQDTYLVEHQKTAASDHRFFTRSVSKISKDSQEHQSKNAASTYCSYWDSEGKLKQVV